MVNEKVNLFQNHNLFAGEVPIRPKDKADSQTGTHRKSHLRTSSDTTKQIEKHQDASGSSCFGKRLGSVKKSKENQDNYDGRTSTYPKSAKGFEFKNNRSLPRTHKLQESQEFDDMKASTESLEFKERSYEMIYGIQQTEREVQFAQNRTLDDRMYQETPKKMGKLVKQYSLTAADKKAMKHQRHNISEESLYPKGSSSKVADSSTTRVKLKSAVQYTPMSLPISQDSKVKMNPKFAFELNLDEKSSKGSKFKLFSKQNEGKKEKTFLGSPKLHRVIFHKSSTDAETWKGNHSHQVYNFICTKAAMMQFDVFRVI